MLFLSWYLVENWGNLRVLLKLRPSELVVIYLVTIGGMLNNSCVVVILLKALDTPVRFWDMVFLQNAANLLNYLPMKFGTVFRANYLKKHYNLSYARFGAFFLYLTVLITAVTVLIGLIVLLLVYGLDRYESKVMFFVFLGTFIVMVFFAFVPLPIPKGSIRLTFILRNFLLSRSQVRTNISAIICCIFFLVINMLLYSLRIGIIYKSMGQEVHFGGYLILGALGYVIMFLSLTPGSLGVRELLLGSGAVALGVPLEVGIFAAVIDRAIMLSWTFLIGGICTMKLWRKSPADFSNAKGTSLDSG